MQRKLIIISLLAMFVLLLPTVSFAYIDPGTGSMVLQALAVAAFSSLFFIKKIFRSIKMFFKKEKKNDGDCVDENE